jgi:hypothetical protein
VRVQERGFQGSLAGRVADVVVERMVEMQQLPRGFRRSVSVQRDRMQLPHPTTVNMIGREAEVRAVVEGLKAAGAAVLVAGPGEGKSTVAMSAGREVWELGLCPGGAYVVDFNGAGTLVFRVVIDAIRSRPDRNDHTALTVPLHTCVSNRLAAAAHPAKLNRPPASRLITAGRVAASVGLMWAFHGLALVLGHLLSIGHVWSQHRDTPPVVEMSPGMWCCLPNADHALLVLAPHLHHSSACLASRVNICCGAPLRFRQGRSSGASLCRRSDATAEGDQYGALLPQLQHRNCTSPAHECVAFLLPCCYTAAKVMSMVLFVEVGSACVATLATCVDAARFSDGQGGCALWRSSSLAVQSVECTGVMTCTLGESRMCGVCHAGSTCNHAGDVRHASVRSSTAADNSWWT